MEKRGGERGGGRGERSTNNDSTKQFLFNTTPTLLGLLLSLCLLPPPPPLHLPLSLTRTLTFHPSSNGPLPVFSETNLEQSNSSGTGSPDDNLSDAISTLITSR